MMKVSIIIPTYNEAKNLEPLAEEIFNSIDKGAIDLELIFVDDNSPDGTGVIAESLKDKYPVKVIHRAGKLGLGSAVIEGFKLSDRPYMGVMDADLSHDPAILNDLIKSLEEYDIAMGSRFAEGSSVERWDIVRKAISTSGVFLAGLITGVKDPLSGYFFFRRDVIRDLDLKTKGYKILLEILVKGRYKKTKQVPFTFRMRQYSTSKLNAEEFVLFFGQILKYGILKSFGLVNNEAAAGIALPEIKSPEVRDEKLDREYWDKYWVENKNKQTLFNSMVAIARKYYFARAFAAFIAANYDIKGKTICEFGVGSGLTLNWLKIMGAGRCVGIDYSPESIKMAQEANPDCEFILADAFNTGLNDKQFDFVYSLGMLEHYDKAKQRQLIEEQKRLAKDCVFIEVPHDIFYFRWLFWINKKLGRTTTFSDEEMFVPRTFKDLDLTGETKQMPSTFFLTIGHFEWLPEAFGKKVLRLVGSDNRLIYGILAALAAFFGFFRLAHQSLWTDESISIVWAASKPLAWIWENVPKADLHPPLYYSILHFWQAAFGASVFSIRSLSVIFFIGSALLIYYFAERLFKSKTAAFMTAVIFITNPFAVLYAQEVRAYSMLIFLIILQAILFHNIVYGKGAKKRDFAYYFLTSLVLIYTNILGLFALLAHFIIILAQKNLTQLRKFFVLYLVLFLAYLPALSTIYRANQYDYSYYGQANGPVDFNFILKSIVVAAGFVGARVNVLNGEFHRYGLLGVSLAAYGAMFAYLILKFKKIDRFVAGFSILSFALLLFFANSKFPVPDPKYFYVVFPFFILLLGNLLCLLSGKNKKLTGAIFAIIIVFNLIFLSYYYSDKRYERENWKNIIASVEADYSASSISEKSGLVVSPFVEPHTTWQYYQTGILPAIGALGVVSTTNSSTVIALEEANIPPKRIIYISRFLQKMYDPTDAIRTYLEAGGYEKTKEFKDTKVEFWRYDLKK